MKFTLSAFAPALALLLFAPQASRAANPEPRPTPFTWVEASVGTDHLNNGSPEWRNASLTLATKSGRKAVYGGISSVQRFGKNDVQYTAGAYIPASPATVFDAEVAISPTHRVLPASEALLTLDHRLADGWGYSLGVRTRSFPSVSVMTEMFSVDRYWKSFRAAYSLGTTQLSNVSGSSLGHSFLFTKYYGPDQLSTLTVFASAGREAENVGGPVLVSSVESGGLSGVHWFAGGTALTWTASLTRQGNLYTRSELQLGFRRRI